MKFNRMLATIRSNIIDLEKQLRDDERAKREGESLTFESFSPFTLSLLFL